MLVASCGLGTLWLHLLPFYSSALAEFRIEAATPH